jgi:trigger factor
LKITTEKLPNCQLAMTIEPDDKQVQEALRRAAAKISRQYTIPGFRRGKAPFAAVARAYGKEVLYEQAVEELGDDLYKQALEETGLDPIAPGTLQDVFFDPLRLQLVLPMPPEVDLGSYREIRRPRPAVEVSDDDVQAQLDDLREHHSEWVPVEEGTAQTGDLLGLRLQSTIDDAIVLDEEAFELALEPDNRDFPPGFDSHFVGQPTGAQVAFTLTYPEDWPSDRAGKEAAFAAEILSIKRQDIPALDDDLATLVGDYDTLDELRQAIREGIQAERQAEANAEYANKVMEAVIEGATIDFPPVMLEESLERVVGEQTRNMERMGLPLSEYLRITRQTEEQFRQQFLLEADRRLRVDLVLGELPGLEGLEASPEEIAEATESLLSSADASGEGVAAFLASPSGQASIAIDILRRKGIERLMAIADGTAPDLPEPAGEGETEAAVEPAADAEPEPVPAE